VDGGDARLNIDVMLIFDAARLALFTVSGTQKALSFNFNPPMAALFGMLTGIGGGMARDLFLAQILQSSRRTFMQPQLCLEQS
jgi:uncharacterized membrane protein YeiH